MIYGVFNMAIGVCAKR